jgi:hypothetical protein
MLDAQRLCAVGGAGTFYIEQRSAASLTSAVKLGAIAISNGKVQTYAVTLLQALPALTTGIAAYDLAVLSTNGSIRLPSLSKCTQGKISTEACSFIALQDAVMVSLANASTTLVGTTSSTTFAADYVRLNSSSITGQRFTPYTVNIVARAFVLSPSSTMDFSADFNVVATFHVYLLGTITQKPFRLDPTSGKGIYSQRSLLHITAGGNVTFGNIAAGNVVVDANIINLEPNALLTKPAELVASSCAVNITQTILACDDYRYSRTLQENNTFIFVANRSIALSGPTLIQASAVLICAPNINVDRGALVVADYRGCSSNEGYGRGGPQSSLSIAAPSGGGGGGYGGIGGNGYRVPSSGLAYVDGHALSSGSGGGCFACNASYSSCGGGIVNVVANDSLTMNGFLSANGAAGSNGAGGGAGGTISVNTLAMFGKGNISARGGAGGGGLYPGGGGGGGVVSLSNYLHTFERFSYTGYVNVKGGAAGAQVTPSVAMLAAQDTEDVLDSPEVYLSWQQSDMTGVALTSPDHRRSLRSYLSPYDDISPATAGADGKSFLPTCQAGTGNDPKTGAVCEACPTGTYSLGGSSDACLKCTNAPTHSHYLDTGGTSPDCPYACDAGYATKHCYNQVQNFIYNIMGVPAFAGMCVGIFLMLMVPLTYQRLKRKYGWFSDDEFSKKKKRDIFGLDFFARNHDDDDDDIFDTSQGKGDKMIKMQKFKTENPIMQNTSTDLGRLSTDSQAQSTRIRTLRNQMFAERRREHRMNDQDLVFHAHRVNLQGSNHPFKSRGTQCS